MTDSLVLCVIKWCTVPDEHLTFEDPQDHPTDCPGCRPAQAEEGLTCRTHSRRLRDHLGAREGIRPHRKDCETPDSCECPDPPHGLAWAWDHLAVAYPMVTGQAFTDSGNGKRPVPDPEAEKLAAVISLRDEMRDVLGAWAADVAERLRMAGPPDVQLTTSPHKDRHVGVDRRIVRNCQAWLLRQVASVEGHESVRALHADLADLMSRAHALAPWRPEPTGIDGVPCRCGACTLHDHGDEILCWNCGSSYTREHYDTLVKVMKHRFAEAETHEPRMPGARTETLRLRQPREGMAS